MSNNDFKIISTPLEDVMEDRFGRYSKYIIQERALPDARDGLKPVQRRILYAMHKDGNVFTRPTRKSAKTVGLVIGNYHPHGDSSVYDAMVRMSQEWKMREPLIDMQGNNGSIDDDPAAAMRYTEARLGKISKLLLTDIDKNTVSFVPNFDDTEQEPTVLPASYPNLLVNGSTGIAAGYATNIAPHNLTEIIEATIFRIMNPECTLDDIMELVPGPDFPTGGIVQGRSGIKEAFETGKGKVVLRAKTEVLTQRLVHQIVITEIPYEVVKSKLVMKLDDIRLSKEVDGIVDVRDETDRTGMRIVVDVRKDVDVNMILNYFYKNSDLQVNYNYNMIAILNKRPKQLGLIDLVDAFVSHREVIIESRSKHDLAVKEKRCHILEGLMKAISVLDDVIQLIRASKNKADAKNRLINKYSFTDVQAEAIVSLQLYRLTNTDIVELKEEFAQLMKDMEELQAILSNKSILHDVIIRELKEAHEQFPSERLTEIHDEVEEIVIDRTSMIANERVMFTLSRDGYLKRVSMRSYNALLDTTTGIKESDVIIGQVEADLLDTILIFTNQGNYAFLPVYQIEEAKWKDIGSHLGKYVKMENEEKIVDALVVKGFETNAWIISMSKKGMIKRTPIGEWVLQRNSKTSSAMNLTKGDEIIRTFVAYQESDIVVMSKEGFTVRYSINEIPSTSTRSKGVRAINLGKGDEVAAAAIIDESTNSLIILTEKALTKRVKATDITSFRRPAKGELIAKKVVSNPNVVRYLFAGQLVSEIWVQNSELRKLQFKDFALMSKTATYSLALTSDEAWFAYQGIEEVKQVDLPEEPEEMPSNDDFDVLRFDLDE